jgi:hypothetical protein
MVKSRRTRWNEMVASVAEMRNDKVLVKSLKGRDHLRDLDKGRRAMLDWTLHKYGVDWINLAQDRRAVVSSVIKFRVS